MPLKRLDQSFRAAGRGLLFAFKSERNFRLQVIATFVVAFFTWLFPLKTWEVILVVLLVTLVLAMELLNTVVEKFSDLLKPRLNQYVLVIKDLMAGAVLVTSLAAAVIGGMIFLPHFLSLLK